MRSYIMSRIYVGEELLENIVNFSDTEKSIIINSREVDDKQIIIRTNRCSSIICPNKLVLSLEETDDKTMITISTGEEEFIINYITLINNYANITLDSSYEENIIIDIDITDIDTTGVENPYVDFPILKGIEFSVDALGVYTGWANILINEKCLSPVKAFTTTSITNDQRDIVESIMRQFSEFDKNICTANTLANSTINAVGIINSFIDEYVICKSIYCDGKLSKEETFFKVPYSQIKGFASKNSNFIIPNSWTATAYSPIFVKDEDTNEWKFIEFESSVTDVNSDWFDKFYETLEDEDNPEKNILSEGIENILDLINEFTTCRSNIQESKSYNPIDEEDFIANNQKYTSNLDRLGEIREELETLYFEYCSNTDDLGIYIIHNDAVKVFNRLTLDSLNNIVQYEINLYNRVYEQ